MVKLPAVVGVDEGAAFSRVSSASRSNAQRGVALAMMVWFVAAMSLLVASIVMQARVDIKLAQVHADRARAEAAGDGAIHLALADWSMLKGEEARQATLGYTAEQVLGGVPVRVTFQSVTGLIDLNLAGQDLLVLLFSSVGGLEENDAVLLAEAVLEWRTAGNKNDTENGGEQEAAELADDPVIRNGRFEAVEDLLLVPGVTRDLYEAVSELTYVGQRGQAGVNWQTAPAQVLQALGGDLSEEQVQAMIDERTSDAESMAAPPAELDLGYQESRTLPLFRADAVVSVGQTAYLRRVWVNRAQSGMDRLPWQFFRVEPVRSLGRVAELTPERNNAGL